MRSLQLQPVVNKPKTQTWPGCPTPPSAAIHTGANMKYGLHCRGGPYLNHRHFKDDNSCTLQSPGEECSHQRKLPFTRLQCHLLHQSALALLTTARTMHTVGALLGFPATEGAIGFLRPGHCLASHLVPVGINLRHVLFHVLPILYARKCFAR